jgi:exonuclease VII large subunit
MNKLTNIAIVISIIALIVGGLAYGKAGGVEDLKARLELAEQKSNRLETEIEAEVQERIDAANTQLELAEQKSDRLETKIEAEAQERLDAANTQLILLEAKAHMLEAKAEMDIGQGYVAAVEKMENAQEKLVEALDTANETLQVQIGELNAEIDTLKQESKGEVEGMIENLQNILDQWEVKLSGSEK